MIGRAGARAVKAKMNSLRSALTALRSGPRPADKAAKELVEVLV